MQKEPLIFMTALGVVGYAVFHGHRLNQDCWLCPYRGWAFMSASAGLGILIGFSGKRLKWTALTDFTFV